DSFCNPSRGPTSTTSTAGGMSIPTSCTQYSRSSSCRLLLPAVSGCVRTITSLVCTQLRGGAPMSQTADRVYSDLHREILNGKRMAGSRVREEEVAETYGVSRTPVREALRRLSSNGLVELIPNRGAEVVNWAADDIEELFDLRSLLEGHAARQAAQRGKVDPARLRDLCTRMEAHLDGSNARAADEI